MMGVKEGASGRQSAELRRLGIKYNPPQLIVEYFSGGEGKLRQRALRLHHLRADSDAGRVTTKLFKCSKILDQNQVSFDQVKRLVVQLVQHLKAQPSTTDSGSSSSSSDTLQRLSTPPADATCEDLNKVSEEELKRRKAEMDREFEKNRKKPGDPDFVYDVQKDFQPTEENEWDEDMPDPEEEELW
eukprot:tig00020934_g16117.t1